MSNDSDAAYRCSKCGATSALLMPEPESRVALKCLHCAHVQRMSRKALEDVTRSIPPARSSEVSSVP